MAWYQWEDREQNYDFSEVERRLKSLDSPLSELKTTPIRLDGEDEDNE